MWSGVITVFQTVEYRPLHLIRGPKLEKTSLTVHHPVVENSGTASRRYPGLDESLFRVGAELILLLKLMKNGRIEALDADWGAVLNQPAFVKAVAEIH